MGALAQVSFGVRFYLGLSAPAERSRYPECCTRAARGYSTDLVRTLHAVYVGKADAEAGTMERVNYRCGRITLAGEPGAFFFKEFPRHHAAHDLERRLRLSRVDRAWRAAHLLPKLGLLTPRAVGTVTRADIGGEVTEYLATEWLPGGLPFPQALRLLGDAPEARAALLREFTELMRRAHAQGVYLRDLVKNVLVREEEGVRAYWLTDLDGVHPIRRVNRRRILFHLGQLAYYCPMSEEEAGLVCEAYVGTTQGEWAGKAREALTGEQAWKVVGR
jgi:hypothetical protein